MPDELSESIYSDEFFKPLLIKHVVSSNGSLTQVGSQRHKVISVEFTVILLAAYGCLCVISVFGNALVCYVIFKNKRLHTATNYFIANLAISDLLVTFVNVPFNIARNLLVDWPFGEIPCHLVNYSLVLTCYVSTYTLTSIALDRHRVVLKPLSRRMSRKMAISIVGFIWVVAISLSLPYGIYMRVLKVQFLITTEFRRCRFKAPKPWTDFEKVLTVTTFILQYCVPFTLIAFAYGRIVKSLWARTHVGAVTANQQLVQARAKRKSIKLLIAVVIVFAICWLPLNMYHLLTDLHPQPDLFQYNTLAFFACHWVAISSSCYNPFVYCWLNEQFRQEVKARFSCLNMRRCRSRQSDVASALLDAVALGKPYPKSLQSCCYNGVKCDTTTLGTDLMKDNTGDSKELAIRNSAVINYRTDPNAAVVVDDTDDDDATTDCTDEATHGLILHLNNGGDCKALYRSCVSGHRVP